MQDRSLFLWLVFERTGDVADYLRYKFFEKDLLKFEVGEEFGIDKNLGDSSKDNPIR
ncbi:MAG: hypothetical protein IJV86_03340 [Clostridia bacterium]|nr:hypothetical protein [Clostridia bacterium]